MTGLICLRRASSVMGAAALLACVAGGVVVDAQQTLTGSNERRTVDCDGDDVSVKGSANTLTLRGECPIVTILGSGNTVAIEATGRINITGTNNKVTWQEALQSKEPRVTRSGLGNVVSRAPAASNDSRDPDTPRGGAAPRGDRAPGGAPPATAEAPAPRRAPSASTAPSEPLVISTDEDTKTYDCEGRSVTVLGNENRLTLRGTCAIIDVQGNRNTVAVDTVRTIETTGNRNRVIWTRAASGDEPKVSNPGSGNVIRRAALP